MTPTDSSPGSTPAVGSDRLYAELSAQLRTTDDTSFRLLGLVPLVSGGGLVGLVLGKDNVPGPMIFLLSLFAATITLAIFRWELRNIQTCDWLRTCLHDLEQHLSDDSVAPPKLPPLPPSPQGWGKTQAEKLLYFTVILTWLAIPQLIPINEPGASAWPMASLVLSVLVFGATVWSLFAKPGSSEPLVLR